MPTTADDVPLLSSTTAVDVVAPTSWQDSILNHLLLLSHDLQRLFLVVVMLGSYPERENHNVRQHPLMEFLQCADDGMPDVSVVTFVFLKSFVELEMEQLRHDVRRLFTTALEDMELGTRLLEVLRAWDGCVALDALASVSLLQDTRKLGCLFDAKLSTAVENLTNVITQVESLLAEMCGEERVVIYLKDATRVWLANPAQRVGKRSARGWRKIYRSILIFTRALPTMAILCALLTVLTVAMLLLDLAAFSGMNLRARYGGSNSTININRGIAAEAEAVNTDSIRLFLTFTQLVLTLGMQLMLRTTATARPSLFDLFKTIGAPFSDAIIKTRMEMKSIREIEDTSNVNDTLPLEVDVFKCENGAAWVNSIQQQQQLRRRQEEEEEEEGGERLDSENNDDICGDMHDGGFRAMNMCTPLCCHHASSELDIIANGVPEGLSPASLKGQGGEHEMPQELYLAEVGEAGSWDDNRSCFVHPQCLQAERETPILVADAPSGIADKFNDLSQLLHLDRTANICRHLVENVQECVCPLVVVECAYQPSTAPGRRRSAACGSYSYPVLYSNAAGLELLHYRWLTDVVGKDLKSLFGLYRPAKRSTRKKRLASGQKGSTLPTLPQTQRRTSTGRFFIVPAPPLRQQRQQQQQQQPQQQQQRHVKQRRLEEIVDPRGLFENGVEDLITVVSTHESLCFEVYAMSIDQIILPSSFCNTEPPFATQSTTKSYLVMLFLRRITDPFEGALKSAPGVVEQTDATPRPRPSSRFSDKSDTVFDSIPYKRASTTTSLCTDLRMPLNALTAECKPIDFGPGPLSSNQRHHNTRTGTLLPGRLRRRSTVKQDWSAMSAERGHVVDQVTVQQLLHRLESLVAVHSVEVSPNVPESFLLNFAALMIFLHRVLKRYNSVNCRVDAENMYILLEVRSREEDGAAQSEDKLCDNIGLSRSSQDIITNDSMTKWNSSMELGISALLSPNLLDYLRMCDASIHLIPNGYVLRFPYTTQERLALMENVGTLQLSTVKGLSLFGVAATNALTEEASAGTSGKMILLHQYAAAEKAFSVAMRMAAFASSQTEDNRNIGSPLKLEMPIGADGSCSSNIALNSNEAFFGPPVSQPIDEVAGSSLDSMCGLPFVMGGSTLKMFEASGPMAGTIGNDLKPSPDAPPMTSSDWQTAGATQPGQVFEDARPQDASEAMGATISCNGLSLGNITSYGKRYLHVFLYMREQRPDVVQYLWARGHSATVVSDSMIMKRYLLIGMHIFDVVFIEWTEKLVTPDIRDLVAVDAGKQSTYLFLLNENTYSLPLPSGTPNEAVLRMKDISDIFTDSSIGHSVSLYIRQRRLRHEMLQIRWRKSYQIVRQIGGGAFGDVYEVYLYVSRGSLAMKRLFLNGASNRVLEQLNREALIMSQLDHPNVVSFSHSSMEDNAYCIFMELCDSTLSQRLQNRGTSTHNNGHSEQQVVNQQSPLPRLSTPTPFQDSSVSSNSSTRSVEADATARTEPLTARDMVLLLRDIASGIAYIHSQGIVHRDIKPCNILFRNGVAKIGDFGTAAEERAAKPLINMKGTLAYMSPEVLLGEPYGKPCDMWSFGCLVTDVIGLHLGHLQGLHVPALIELYKSIPLTQSLPITVSNYKGGTLQNHCLDSKARMILGAMKNACSERPETATLRRSVNSLSQREKSNPSHHDDSEDAHFHSSTSCDSTRAVAYISTSSTAFLGSEKAELPESLVDLLERLFHRDPQKRMTAKEVLDHPVTWDVEWMEMVMRAVEEICPLEGEDMATDASHCGDSFTGDRNDLDLSITST